MYRLSEFKRLEELFFEYGEGMRGKYLNTLITADKFKEALYEIETEYIQLVRAARKGGTGALVSKRKGKEATPERTSYDVGHSV